MKSQYKEILIHLVNGKSITPLEALEKFGCFRLSGRIYDLKKNGWDIKTRMIKKNNKYFAEYYLPETNKLTKKRNTQKQLNSNIKISKL